MRGSKAYIAGIGTATILVASALPLLAVGSALLAFQGWPARSLPDAVERLVVREPDSAPAVERPGDGAPDAAEVDSAGASAARHGAASSPAGSSEGTSAEGVGGERSPTTQPAPRRAAPRRPDPAAVKRQAPAKPAPTEELPGAPNVSPPATALELLTASLGDTSHRVTNGLGDLLGGLSPLLPRQVRRTGDALAEGLRRLGASPGAAENRTLDEANRQIVDLQVPLQRAVMAAGEDQ